MSKLSFSINDALLDQAFFFVNQLVAESVERLFFLHIFAEFEEQALYVDSFLIPKADRSSQSYNIKMGIITVNTTLSQNTFQIKRKILK